MPRDKAHLCSGKDWPAESASGLYTNGTGKHGHSRRIRLADWFESAAFFVLLLVVAMRPLLSETYESYRYSLERLSSIPDVTSPATTLWFDLAVWLSAVLAVVAVLLKGVRWRWTGLEPGWFFLLTGAVISTCFAASNRRIATTASADWLTAVVLICLLANLCRDRLRVNLVLAVLLASGTASVAKDIMQVKVEFEETRQYYEQEIKNRQASHADEEEPDSQIKLYVARMNAGEAYGFFPYSNAQGAWLGLCGFAALAMLGNKARYRSQQALFVVLAVVLFASIAMTGSKGGLVAVAVGL